MIIPERLKSYLDRPVAVFGKGISGQGAAKVLRTLGLSYSLLDEAYGDTFTEAQAQTLGLVIYSPGFPQNHPWLLAARAAGCLCLTEIDFAAAFWPGSLVAITGTNGKTTTTELLAAAFQSTGIPAVAAGNIGHPLSEAILLPRAKMRLAVCEISSFQAEDLHFFQPSALIWTNFSNDHLDRYGSLEAYFAAKWKLVERLQRPKLFVGPSVAVAAKAYGYELPSFTEVVSLEEDVDLALQETIFMRPPQRENYLLARHYWKSEGYPIEALLQGAFHLPFSPHRLREVRTVRGVAFWNDSKATNFASALAAVSAFDKPVLWIGGGSSKEGDIPPFVQQLAPHLKEAFLIGQTAPDLKLELETRGKMAQIHNDLPSAIKAAFAKAVPGDVVLLSPGFASFGLFKNYADRGEVFTQTVLAL
jgi:UDP-N-acetylmuramoylalanine--D-glutamate ligase